MEDGDEPPDHPKNESALIRITNDIRIRILLRSKGEKAVCQPATLDGHFTYRVRKNATNGYKEKSFLKYQRLEKPYILNNDPRTLMRPETKYEKDGIEDARLSKLEDEIYGITYVAFNEDIENGGTSICLATTQDFKKIKRRGIIGPRIRFEEAIELFGGNNTYYGERLSRELKEIRNEHGNINPFVMDKDPALLYDTESGEYIFFHRVDSSIQVAKAKDISDFQKQNFWRKHFSKLHEKTILCPGTNDSVEKWASEKVGMGGTPRLINEKLLCHVHGVEKTEGDNKVDYIYSGTFAEFNPTTYKLKSIIRDPLLRPREGYYFEEFSNGTKIRKYVNFPFDMLKDPDNPNILWNYSGEHDFAIETRSTNLEILLKGLSSPDNIIANWKGNRVLS